MDEARLNTILERFRERKILVVGDFYLDAYWIVDKTKSTLSLETPWHTNPVVEQRYSPGAAGTVTNNLACARGRRNLHAGRDRRRRLWQYPMLECI